MKKKTRCSNVFLLGNGKISASFHLLNPNNMTGTKQIKNYTKFKYAFTFFSRNIKNIFDYLPGSWQQSALSGNRWPAQFPIPQVRVPSHSLSLSQSPWFIPHICSVVQQLQKLWHSEINDSYLFYHLQENSTILVKLASIKIFDSSTASSIVT